MDIAIADTPQDFADEVLRLLQDGSARQAMGQAARDFVSWYDWTPIAARYQELYRGLGRGGDYNLEVQRGRAEGRHPEPALELPLDKQGIEAHLPPREPSKPLTLLLLINRGCNLRCSFCDLWDRPQELSYERCVQLLDEAQAIGTKTLVITGGEPFIHKDLFRVVQAAVERGMGVNITTNGTLIEKRFDELVASGVHSLSVSLDGLKEVHEELRGQPGCHSRTWKGLNKLREGSDIGLSIYFVATNKNVHQLEAVYEQAQQLGARFDFWPVNEAPELALSAPEHQELYRRAVARIASEQPEIAARRLFDEEGLRYHAGHAAKLRCLGLVDQYGVTYEGELLPCCVWEGEGLSVGNVFETPLSELWTSEAVQSARERLYGEGCSAGCFNHSLYEFTRSTGESFLVE